MRGESGRVDAGLTVRAQAQVVFSLVGSRQRTVVIQWSAHHFSLYHSQPLIITYLLPHNNTRKNTKENILNTTAICICINNGIA